MKIEEYRTNPVVSKSPVILDYVERSSRFGNVTPESILVAEIASKIVKGIQFPKSGKGTGKPLSASDIEEIISIVSYTLAIRGVFRKSGTFSKLDFKACRKAVRASDTGLSLFRHATVDLSEITAWKAAKSEAETGKPLISKRKRESIISRFQYLELCISLALLVDKSPRRKWKAAKAALILNFARIEAMHGFSGTVSFPRKWRANTKHFLSIESQAREVNRAKSARKDAKKFFIEYVATGQKAYNQL